LIPTATRRRLLNLPPDAPTQEETGKEPDMARPPNYSQERKERDRVKAARKAEKLAAKAAARERGKSEPEAEDAEADSE
jgi:hypothetical protein